MRGTSAFKYIRRSSFGVPGRNNRANRRSAASFCPAAVFPTWENYSLGKEIWKFASERNVQGKIRGLGSRSTTAEVGELSVVAFEGEECVPEVVTRQTARDKEMRPSK